MLIRDVRIDGRRVDLRLRDGLIVETGPGLDAAEGEALLEGQGRLALPALVDGHVHLDKTLIGLPFIPHIPGTTIAARIAAERHLRRSVALPVADRARALIARLSALGTVALRSHVDIDPEVGLDSLHQILALKAELAGVMQIQTVAFPQSGILREPGTAALLEEAAKAGVDLIGGLDPAGIDGDITGHLDTIFGLAERHGLGLDIHLHDGGELGAHELSQIARRTARAGLSGRVNVSHAFCLGALSPDAFARIAAELAEAGVSIMTSAPGPVPMPPVKALRAAGVTVFAANDNIRDAWSPFGSGDLLERAAILCDRQDFRADADLELALDLVSTVPGAVLGRPRADLTPGALADLMLVPAGSRAEAVAARPPERLVIKGGRVVAGAQVM
ncbi:amidohydrolase family protein [Pseudooceanicola sp. CBS1P-1]|uniref:Amidohydrolase family protein n=1 Tax=Pseudooceanicola albus TaxID=2692189 RepID=A0A6L7G7Z0_9RHOB|nr:MULTISPECIES: amidohydrolase [Pseudooceanicola]MBT9385921.1 amidohydrolase family protein [Pseudooceanicola endophyticus]MXN19658.1 amidohydrolase family protein [Pseudooceanicola albus]